MSQQIVGGVIEEKNQPRTFYDSIIPKEVSDALGIHDREMLYGMPLYRYAII